MVRISARKPILRELGRPLEKDWRYLGQKPVLEALWGVGKGGPEGERKKGKPQQMEVTIKVEIT